MGKEYNITRATGRCAACERQMQPGEEFIALVRPAPEDAEEEFLRADFCLACWASDGEQMRNGPGVLGVWRSRVPEPSQKRKTFVDDDLLVSFFERLDGTEEPAKRDFRFVLALILMRKKLLVYDRARQGADGLDIWTMHFKGNERTCEVVDPHLDEGRIADVSGQLGHILEGEL